MIQVKNLGTYKNTLKSYNSLLGVAVNVKHFGAVGDGVTDDTAAIQSAFNSNKDVFFPQGTYKITSSLFYKPHVKIYGSGVNSIITSYINNGFAFDFDYAFYGFGPQGTVIQNIQIKGTNSTGSGGGINIIGSGHGMKITDCWISYFQSIGQIGVNLAYQNYYITLENINIDHCDIGINMDGTAYIVNAINILNCKLTSGSIGIKINNAVGTKIINTQIELFSEYAISAFTAYQTIIENCWLERNAKDIKFGSNSDKSIISKCRFIGSNNTRAIEVYAGNCIIENSDFTTYTKSPIYSEAITLYLSKNTSNYSPAAFITNTALFNSHQVIYRSTIPTSGLYHAADIIFNTVPIAGGNIGWVCITSGSPGIWKSFGVIEN